MTTIVGELLDLDLDAATPSLPIRPASVVGFPFTLSNLGNGREAFLLQGRLEGAGTLQGFAIDADGNGRYDPAVDVPVVSVTPPLNAGTSFRLLAIVQSGPTEETGILVVRASAATGSGAPGTSFIGRGDGGDAVVGATTASDEISVTLTASGGTDLADIVVIKSQQVLAPDGSANPTAGAVITYIVEARFGDDAVVERASLFDPIPAGTVFVPGSLRLNGVALTDIEDGDAGALDAMAVRVALDDVRGPTVRILQFQVTIQ